MFFLFTEANYLYCTNSSLLIELICHYSKNGKILQFLYGGELTVQNTPEILGDVIKAARQRSGITMEELAYKVGVTERYLYRIENENKKPSFDVLFQLIRELSIFPDEIFYPEMNNVNLDLEQLIRMLYTLDPETLSIIKSIVEIFFKKL